jgi:hypothetical protein
MKTKNEAHLDEQLRKIMQEVEAENPYEVFEPHLSEEGLHDILELYDSRLRKLFVEKVLHGDDPKLSRYFLGIIEDELGRCYN